MSRLRSLRQRRSLRSQRFLRSLRRDTDSQFTEGMLHERIQSRGAIFQYGGDPFWIGVALGAVNRLHYDAFPNSLDYGLVVDEVDYLHRLPPPLK